MILRDARVYVGGYDLSGDHNQIAVELAFPELNDTVFGDTAASIAAGMEQITATGAGFVRLGPTGSRVIRDNLGIDNVPMTILSGDPEVEDAAAETFRGMALTYRVAAQVGQLLAFNWTAKGQGTASIPVRPLIGRDTVIDTPTGHTAATEVGPVVAGAALVVSLHVLDAAPGGTLDLVIVSAPDDTFATPTVRATIPTIHGADAPASRTVSVAGPISDAWWRAQWTLGGPAPSFDVVLVAGLSA